MAADNDQRTVSLVGRTLKAKWRLEAQIGSGGMASVWAARHRNGKRVAIKLLHAELSRDDSIRARFLREGYVANKVGHPSVVTILDDDDDDDLVFLVMELLEGETLSERWKKAHARRLELREVLRVADEVLDVLAASHDKQIIHRDIKPANVFLTRKGEVKILDFGIARLHEGPGGTGHTTRLGTALGSPAFMSPEQARARWEFVDARTDLWAVGALMFSTLSGRLVHGSKTSSELIIATATQPAPSLREAWPEAPDVVAAIVDRALAFERAERWQDARSMQAVVRRALDIDFERPRRPLSSLTEASVMMPAPPSRPPEITARVVSGSDAVVSGPAEPAAPSTQVTALTPTIQQTGSDSTTSAPVAAPADSGDLTMPPPPQRSLGATALLGMFIALGLIGGGVAIGLLSRRAPIVVAPSVVAAAPPPSVTAAVPSATPAEAPPDPSASVGAPSATAAPSATEAPVAAAAPSAAPTATPSATAPKKKRPAPPRSVPPRGRGKFTPSTL